MPSPCLPLCPSSDLARVGHGLKPILCPGAGTESPDPPHEDPNTGMQRQQQWRRRAWRDPGQLRGSSLRLPVHKHPTETGSLPLGPAGQGSEVSAQCPWTPGLPLEGSQTCEVGGRSHAANSVQQAEQPPAVAGRGWRTRAQRARAACASASRCALPLARFAQLSVITELVTLSPAHLPADKPWASCTRRRGLWCERRSMWSKE